MTEPNNGVSLQNNGKKEKRGYKKKAFTFYIYFSDMSGRQVAKNWILGYHNASGIFKLTDFSSCPEKYLSLSKNEEKHRSTLLKTNFLLIRDTWKTENPILGTLYSTNSSTQWATKIKMCQHSDSPPGGKSLWCQ